MTEIKLENSNTIVKRDALPDGASLVRRVPKSIGRPNFDTLHRSISAIYEYRWQDGGLACFVIRSDYKDRKTFSPITLWSDEQHTGIWYCTELPDERPLYNLPYLVERSEDIVLVAEGKKCANAMASAFPEYVSTTWLGGSNAIGRTDFSPLRGRSVVILADHDDAGEKAAEELCKTLEKIDDAKTVTLSACSIAAKIGVEPDRGWDIADAITHGFSAAQLTEMLSESSEFHEPDLSGVGKSNDQPSDELIMTAPNSPTAAPPAPRSPNAPEKTFEEQSWPETAHKAFGFEQCFDGAFKATEKGIVKYSLDRKGTPVGSFVCSPMVILGRTVVGTDYAVRDRCGYRREQEDSSQTYYIYDQAWKSEVCGDHDPGLMLEIAAERRALIRGENGRKMLKQRLPDYPNGTRVVAIRPHLL